MTLKDLKEFLKKLHMDLESFYKNDDDIILQLTYVLENINILRGKLITEFEISVPEEKADYLAYKLILLLKETYLSCFEKKYLTSDFTIKEPEFAKLILTELVHIVSLVTTNNQSFAKINNLSTFKKLLDLKITSDDHDAKMYDSLISDLILGRKLIIDVETNLKKIISPTSEKDNLSISSFKYENIDQTSKRIIGEGAFGEICTVKYKEKKLFGSKEFEIVEKKSKNNSNLINEFEFNKLVKSPYIMSVFYFVNSSIYMELSSVGTLDSYLKSHDYSGSDIFNWSRDCLEGLYAIHVNEIVHYDIKLENLFMFWQEDRYQIKIGDFGCATMQSDANLWTYDINTFSVVFKQICTNTRDVDRDEVFSSPENNPKIIFAANTSMPSFFKRVAALSEQPIPKDANQLLDMYKQVTLDELIEISKFKNKL